MKASVVIPTKEPGRIFQQVLDRTLAQKAPWPFEIIVIDSGSRDGTVDYARSRQATVITISPESYGHGRTRNLAISRARGEFVALLTHDAMPADDRWLANLVAAVEQHPSIAGAFGRHIAYEHASPFTKRDLDNHFAGFLTHPLVVNRDTDQERFARDVGWCQFLHFYSDCNSCLRRSVWQRLPYPDVEFAEDQIWAQRVIESGWSKAYAPDAIVYHSHDFTVVDSLRRAFDESAAFRRLFGYRLGGTPWQMLRSIIGLSVADWSWAKANGVTRAQARKRVLQDAARVIGHGLGARVDSLPSWIQTRVSRDRRMFRSLLVSQ
jgi:rhamnosyltransferase